MSVKNVMRVLAGTAGVLLVAGAAGPGAAAVSAEDTGDVQAVVRKTVRQAGSATGEISNSTMYTQISAVGSGTKTVKVPVGTTSNRNLNAFGPFPMEGESMVVELTVTDGGGTEQRTVTDADINPMAVSVKVMLDGAEVAPEDLVGASGVLDVEYTVRNTTATTAPVTFTDVEGNEVTEDVETADPFVGSLDVVLPQGFNEISAPGATVAGNGQNETQLGYTFVLFPPLGSTEVKVGYQSRISNGQMPAAEFSFLPIIPFENSTIDGTTKSLKGAVESSTTLFGAGTQIGENLLKLQEGAGQLVAGLGQLSAGASQLSDGLVNTAAPGSAALADGANQVSDGLSQLNDNVPALADGVEQLNDGAAQLNDGAEQVADGNAELAAGIASLNAGLNTLSKSVAALPATVNEQLKTNADYQLLLGTLTKLIAGIGTPTDSTSATLEGALNQVIGGLRYPGTTDCQVALTGGTPTKCSVADANAFVAGALTKAQPELTTLADSFRDLVPLLPDPYKGLQTELANCIDGASQCDASLYDPAGDWPKATIMAQTVVAAGALNKVVASIDGLLIPGVQQIKKALYNSPCNPKQTDPKAADFCGYAQALTLVKDGIPTLVSALTQSISQTLLAGVGSSPAAKGCDPTKTLTCASAALTAGSAALASGASQLADGTETLAEGTEELNSNVPTLASGVEKLDDGAAQVADGADQLADGLGAAADGSGQIADGLAQAEPGGAQIEAGAGQLKEEGADVLAETGKEAQLDYARRVALLEAAQQAGLEGAGIPFGPAEGTDVTTTAAYKMYLAGIAADTENNALKFGLGALLIAGAGGAAFAARRRATV